MVEEFCKAEYINNTAHNTLNLYQDELGELYNAFNNGKNIGLIIIGEPGGRTFGAMNVGTCEIPYIERGIHPANPLNYAKTLEGALPELEKTYDKILILAGSQTGTKPTVCSEVIQAGNYLDRTKSKKTELSLMTSHPESETGKIVKEHGGAILRLKGLEEGMDPNDYKRVGFLGDLFELGTATTLQTLTEMLYRHARVEDFYGIATKGFKNIGEIIDAESSKSFFDNATNDMIKSSNVFLGGYRGPAEIVSKTACVRDNQFKGLLRDYLGAYAMSESSTKAPMPGDQGIWTSWSGGKGEVYTAPTVPNPSYVVSWCKNLQKKRGNCYSIVGNKETPLADCTPKDNVLLVKEPESETRGPLWFYTSALFAHTAIPNIAMQKVEDMGLFKYSAHELRSRHHMD